ncbi:unnamed protein product, partial [Musa acuminata var. zebrina]
RKSSKNHERGRDSSEDHYRDRDSTPTTTTVASRTRTTTATTASEVFHPLTTSPTLALTTASASPAGRGTRLIASV